MKPLFFLLFSFGSSILFSQVSDSVFIKRVDSLIQLSGALARKGEFAKALELNIEADSIALNNLGYESEAYGDCCTNKGYLFSSKGNFSDAEKYYLQSKEIREKTQGSRHPKFAVSLRDLGILYWEMGLYEKAEPLFTLCAQIQRTTIGRSNLSYAGTLHNQGILYWTMGLYEKAEDFYLESKTIRENILGKRHAQYAQSLSNIAMLYKDMGLYEKAEDLSLQSKHIQEEALGKNHPHYAQSLSNLAGIYMEIGQYKKAEQLCVESKNIQENIFGKRHPYYAMNLINLAVLYQQMGEPEKADSLLKESTNVLEKTFGKTHPIYAQNISNFGSLYESIGMFEKAEGYFKEASNLQKVSFGVNHPDFAQSLFNLGSVYLAMNQPEKAKSFYLDSKSIWEKSLGKQHLFLAKNLAFLALVYQELGQYQEAENLLQESQKIDKNLIVNAINHLSENEINQYLMQFSQGQNQIFSFPNIENRPKLLSNCFNSNLFYKGFLLHNASEIRYKAFEDSLSTEKFNLLKSYQRRLARQYTKPISERDSTLVAELETKAEVVEKDLARTVAGYADARKQVTWQDVQSALKQGEAAVEFVHYNFYHKKETDSIMYAALVLTPDADVPKFVPLFEEKSLDSLLSPFENRKADYVNHLYAMADRGAKALKKPGKSLYQLILEPIEKVLLPTLSKGGDNRPTIFFSSTGLLHRINLNAIPIDDETTISERFSLVGMGSTRSLFIPSKVDLKNYDALLFGGVRYETDTTAITAVNSNIISDTWTTRGGELSFYFTDSTDRTGTWDYLQWTKKEVESIEPLLQKGGFKTTSRKGFAASEEAFKSIGQKGPSPRILHIATHGYFFPDPEKLKNDRFSFGEDQSFRISEHPMIRSGLIMAGGNHAWKTGKPIKPDMEDGILTAYEISQMNLRNTELVVLSACETGLGDIKGNEGVYGLQRAFKIAGAKYLIMSLWQVPDKETAFFMELFYKKMTEEKLPIPEAFKATQSALRQNPFITPYQWAGFVLVE